MVYSRDVGSHQVVLHVGVDIVSSCDACFGTLTRVFGGVGLSRPPPLTACLVLLTSLRALRLVVACECGVLPPSPHLAAPTPCKDRQHRPTPIP